MFRYALNFFALLALCAQSSYGFSLLGPLDDRFQNDTVMSYNQYAGDIGGPMLLNEEYRWAKPVVTYGYDKTFLDFYGAEGVRAIEEAIAVMNAIPAASTMSDSLREFPLEAKGVNQKAAALGIQDIKTAALGYLLNTMGVGQSTRWAYTLRHHWTVQDVEQFITINRSYDPETWAQSSYINDALYTFNILLVQTDPDEWDAYEIPNDELFASSRTPASSIFDVFRPAAFAGEYFYGLTRDDIGAIRYLYHPENINVETLPAGASGIPINLAGAGGVGGGGGGGFGAPPALLTGGGSLSPWGNPFGTNLFTSVVVTNTDPNAGVPGTVATNPVVSAAFRGGADKVTFVRMESIAGLGVWNAVTNRWVDTYYTNVGTQLRVIRQGVEQVVNSPDIIFGAGDVGLVENTPAASDIGQATTWVNNADLNTFTGTGENAGPGVVTAPMVFTFSSLGPWWSNTENSVLEGPAILYWGSYDGSTREPIVFPLRTSIQDLENRVLGQ